MSFITLRRVLATLLLPFPFVLGSVPTVWGYGAGFEPPQVPPDSKQQGPSIMGDVVWTVSAGNPDSIVFTGGKCGNMTLADWNLNSTGEKKSDPAAFSGASGKDIEAFLEGTCTDCDPVAFQISETPADVQACYAAKPTVFMIFVTGAQTQIKSSASWTGKVHFTGVATQP